MVGWCTPHGSRESCHCRHDVRWLCQTGGPLAGFFFEPMGIWPPHDQSPDLTRPTRDPRMGSREDLSQSHGFAVFIHHASDASRLASEMRLDRLQPVYGQWPVVQPWPCVGRAMGLDLAGNWLQTSSPPPRPWDLGIGERFCVSQRVPPSTLRW